MPARRADRGAHGPRALAIRAGTRGAPLGIDDASALREECGKREGRHGTQEASGPIPGLPGRWSPTPALGPLRGLLLTLTVVTGVVDAVSILALGRVFVANMTGNVVFAAFAVVGAPGFSLSASLFALAGFLVGAYFGGVLIGRLGRDRGLLLRAGGAAELAFAAVALVVAATSGDPGVTHGTIGLAGGEFGAAVTDAIAALLAIALGVQNAVARKLAVPDMTTTVLTMTLTGVGADIRAVFGDRPRASARVAWSEGARRRPSDGTRERAEAAPAPAAARSALGRRLLAVAAMIVGAARGRVPGLAGEPALRPGPGRGPAGAGDGVGRAGHSPPSRLARVPGRETLSTSRCYPHTSIPTPRPRCAR